MNKFMSVSLIVIGLIGGATWGAAGFYGDKMAFNLTNQTSENCDCRYLS